MVTNYNVDTAHFASLVVVGGAGRTGLYRVRVMLRVMLRVTCRTGLRCVNASHPAHDEGVPVESQRCIESSVT